MKHKLTFESILEIIAIAINHALWLHIPFVTASWWLYWPSNRTHFFVKDDYFFFLISNLIISISVNKDDTKKTFIKIAVTSKLAKLHYIFWAHGALGGGDSVPTSTDDSLDQLLLFLLIKVWGKGKGIQRKSFFYNVNVTWHNFTSRKILPNTM